MGLAFNTVIYNIILIQLKWRAGWTTVRNPVEYIVVNLIMFEFVSDVVWVV